MQRAGLHPRVRQERLHLRRNLNVHGHYSFQLPDLAGTRRALRDPDSGDDEEH